MCSLLIAQDHQQRGGTHNSPRPPAHGLGHGVINKLRKGSAIVGNIIRDGFSPGAVVDVSSLTNLPGATAPGLSRIQIGSRLPSLTLSRSRMRGSLRCASGTLSMQRRCSSTVAAQSLPVQPIQKRVCNRITIHRSNVLSSSLSLVGFDANGKDLTIGTRSLPPEGKTHD